jgi:hypothetical protein
MIYFFTLSVIIMRATLPNKSLKRSAKFSLFSLDIVPGNRLVIPNLDK